MKDIRTHSILEFGHGIAPGESFVMQSKNNDEFLLSSAGTCDGPDGIMRIWVCVAVTGLMEGKVLGLFPSRVHRDIDRELADLKRQFDAFLREHVKMFMTHAGAHLH